MLITQKLVMTKDIGCNDGLFGGIMLEWLDEAGAIEALALTDEPRMVTFKMSEMTFKKPVKVGDIVQFHSNGVKRGNTSITIEIQAKVKLVVVAEVTMTFVCIDENGDKKLIKKFQPRKEIKPRFGNDNVKANLHFCPTIIHMKNGEEYLCSQNWNYLEDNVKEFNEANSKELVHVKKQEYGDNLYVWDLNEKKFRLLIRDDIAWTNVTTYHGTMYFE
jgi:acyl-CoA thioesterase YciA